MKFIWPKSAHRKGIYKMDIIAFHHLLNFRALAHTHTQPHIHRTDCEWIRVQLPICVISGHQPLAMAKKSIKVKIIILYFL